VIARMLENRSNYRTAELPGPDPIKFGIYKLRPKWSFSRAGGVQVAAQMIRAEGRRVFENVGPDHANFSHIILRTVHYLLSGFVKF
jgi:hypothetical protein